MIWQSTMAQADQSVSSRNFEAAQQALKQAETLARGFGDGKIRLEATLKAKAALYDKWENHAEELEKVNLEIGSIQADRLRVELKRQLAIIDRFKKDSQGASPVRETSLKLDAEAQLPSLINTGTKLYGCGMYDEMEQLLKRALDAERRLLGANSVAVAQIETHLADSLIAQRKYPDVRVYLLDACVVRRSRKDIEPVDLVRALAKLGQFDLDQSDYKDAEAELKEAYDMVKGQKILGESKAREVAVLVMRSYGELLRQTNKKAESETIIKEADALDK